jgi:hypothetical protein
MCVGAETEVKRYVPPRKGTLTLIITDGFTLKVLWIVCVLTVLLRGVVWLTEILWTTDCCVLSVQFARTCPALICFPDCRTRTACCRPRTGSTSTRSRARAATCSR